MKYSAEPYEFNLVEGGFLFEIGSLVDALGGLQDGRDARGLRYALVTVLVYVVLAKLSGEHSLRGIAQWVAHRAQELTDMLGLAKVQVPHATTYSRILGQAIRVEELERVSREFFATPRPGKQVLMAIDGKVIRGTIPAGRSRGVHLLAAYLPNEGVVLAQVQLRREENEISAAARLLRMVDLRGKIVTGDAIMAQRDLSKQVVRAGGEYIWPIKENQPDTYEDIRVLFEPEARAKGFAPAKRRFGRATTTEKGHGRLEKRTIKVSSALKGYLDWPHAEQVFMIERRVRRLVDGKKSEEATYGITSLTPQEASPAELLALARKHWAIENSLHYCRDDTLREDRCTLRTGTAARAMATINNLLLGLLRHKGVTSVPDARRLFAARREEAWKLISLRP